MSSLTYNNPELEDVLFPGHQVYLKYGVGPLPENTGNKKIFLFDIDNCLYERSTRIHDMMQVKIHKYFKETLLLSDKDAHDLHLNYYRTYGLALEGLVRNHKVDAMEYNLKVDDALDLKLVLHFNPNLREMLMQIKNSGQFDMFWLVTNAYKNHALRVISFLGIGDLFDGLTYCDYSLNPIVCKPMKEFYYHCLRTIGIDSKDNSQTSRLYFVDDSEINVKAAYNLAFGRVFHYVEMDEEYETLKQKEDFEEYYGRGDNSDKAKIQIIRLILELPKYI
ncbi:pyrimidine 5-nucleotidase [Metschnikowia bicuspidata var. bicuspidata NRRL YB-4993]|uniref:Pyrimidine 5-nucleotidase n=1 Tax=Metschnikowia bicuspidata var. bicuspidata NRRL YB-4993 TaxID=869754 RepID=A0A1A0H5V6_9ASCO|nr:pyrimidine 5-nucleotidase [Metschnikowia bicuspidata var. bicuspidata NRRL YB-4993]OBA19298.1 pyrimidine 5-nucleotidase [Metschnikowia bicuspidata var. bicuspidata NRRL YB-4993]